MCRLELPCGTAGKQSEHRREGARGGPGGRRNAQALVEMALVLPMMLLLLLAMIDFGRAYYAGAVAVGAARQGAMLAMDYSKTNAEVIARVQEAASPYAITSSNVSISPSSRSAASSGSSVTVSITLSVPLLTTFLAERLGISQITVASRAEVVVL